MLIDVIAAVLLLLALWKGFSKGLIVALFSFLAFVVGLAAALKLSSLAATWIGEAVSVSQRWLPVIAFIAVFLLVVLLIRLGARMLEGLTNVVMLGWVNKLGGIIFYILIYFFIFSILLFYASNLRLLQPTVTGSSFFYPLIQPLGPKCIGVIGAVLPFFRDMFGELLEFFGQASDKNHPA